MANLISWAKKRIQDVEHAVGGVAQGAGHAAQGAARTVGHVAQDAANVEQTALRPAQKLLQAAPKLVSNIGQSLPVLPGGVSVNTLKAAQKYVVQPTAHGALEIPASLTHQTITPPKAITAITGKEPVKPIQEDVRGVYRAVKAGNQNLPGGIPISSKLAAPYAAADALLHLGQDVPLIGGAVKGAKTVAAPVVEDALRSANAARVPLNEAGAVGKNVRPEIPKPSEPSTPKVAVPAKPATPKPAETAPKGTLYHGTAADTTVTELKPGTSGNRGPGVYLTNNPEAAQYHSFVADQSSQLKALHNEGDLTKTPEARLGKVVPVQIDKSAKIAQLDHAPTPKEVTSLKGQGYHGATFTEDLYKNAQDIPRGLVNPSKMEGAKTTVVFDESKLKTGAPQIPRTGQVTARPKFASGVATSTEVSPELQAKVAATDIGYNPVRNQQQLAISEARFSRGYKKQAAAVNEELAGKVINDQHVADAIQAIKKLDEKGGTANHSLATDITTKLSQHLTKAGQKIQAARLLGNRTPEGMLFGARRELNKHGVEITPTLESKLQAHIAKIKSLPQNSEERDRAMAELVDTVARQIPSSVADKATSLWKAGLLTGLKTQSGNALSNVSNIGLKTVSNVPAAGIDRLIALRTGERTKTLTLKGSLSGGAEGIEKGYKALRTGIDERNLEHIKFDTKRVNFGPSKAGRAADAYVNTIFNLMGAADRPYYYSQLRNTLNDLGKAEAINKGLKGAERKAYIKAYVKDPPEKGFQTATDAAEKAIFANDTTLSNIAAGVRRAAQKNSVASAAVNVIMPFTKVPSAIITRLFDYTPVGAVKEIIQQIHAGKFDQRAMSEALAEAGTGTGALAIGYELFKNGMITGDYPTNDKKQQELWKLEGKQPNAIKIGGKWLSFNYTSPVGQVIQTGGQIANAASKGSSLLDALGSGVLGAGKTVLGQSFLQGVQGALDAINDPQRSLKQYEQSQAGSVIPTIIGDVAKATDATQRQVKGVTQAVEARIPGLNKKLPAKVDALGNQIPRASSAVNTLLNPFRPSDIRPNSPAGQELDRLYTKLGSADAPSFAPPTTVTVGTTKVPLQGKLLSDYQAKAGPIISQGVENLLKNPDYQRMSDADKSAAVNKVIHAARDATTAQMASTLAPKDKLTTKQGATSALAQQALSDPSKLGGDLTTATDTRKAKYTKDMAGFSKLSAIDKQIKGPTIVREGVEVNYPKDVVSLYGQSAKKIQMYFDNNPNDTKTRDQLAKLDADLYAKGVTTKRKISGSGTVASSSSGGKKSSKSTKVKKQFTIPSGGTKATNNKSVASLVKGSRVSRKTPSVRNVKPKRVAIPKIKQPRVVG